MDMNECKSFFKDKYGKVDFKLIDEHPTELFYEMQSGKLKIPENEIDFYCKNERQIAQAQIVDNGCAILTPEYREQMVKHLRPFGPPIGLFADEERPFVFGDKNGSEPYVEVSPASEFFISCIRFEECFIEYMRVRRNSYQRNDFGEVFDYRRRTLTIKVHNLGKLTIEEAKKASDQLIDACFFELAYLNSITLGLADEWPNIAPRRSRRQFQLGERHQGREMPFPKNSFNSDIVRFYLMGMSSDVPALQFLSFYQVLEYFFVAVSDENLYMKLRTRLIDPKFRPSPTNLDKVILDVTNHKKTNDETEMLKGVITKYVEESDIMEFIIEYEKYLNDNLYTKKRIRFGIEAEVKLNPGHIIGNVAKVIKIVRNALVHSSDHYERTERHVPFSDSTKIVQGEIPLIKFIAEKVIIGSAK